MKILVVGIDGVDASSLFSDERLSNLRRLMEYGCFGLLERERPANAAEAWACLLTSQPVETLRVETVDTSLGLLAFRGHAVSQQVEALGGKAIVLWEAEESGEQAQAEAYSNSRRRFELARHKLQTEDWDYLQVVDGDLTQLQAMVTAGQIQERALTDYYLHLDEQIGALFESLSDETLALVISPYGVEGQGWFILASSNNPLSGEVADVSLLEIAPTLLELGGYPISETMQGVSLVAGKALDLLASGDLSDEEEQLLRERLSGLGYIS